MRGSLNPSSAWVEGLEGRWLLSAFVRGDVLIVEGEGGGNDLISIGTRDGGATIRVHVNGGRAYFDGAGVHRIEAYGYRGRDRIEIAEALTQAARVEGGKGNDTMISGGGDDSLYGNEGVDRVSGGSGDDRILGSPGNDSLLGEAGSDTIYGGSGNDHINGGDGNDDLFVLVIGHDSAPFSNSEKTKYK